MNEYTIYCTPEQTKKALELGAPIGVVHKVHNDGITEEVKFVNPTADQMINWLEEQGFYFRIETTGSSVEIDAKCIIEIHNSTRKEATISAIDAALEYLINDKK